MIICYGQILDSNVNSCFFLSFIFCYPGYLTWKSNALSTSCTCTLPINGRIIYSVSVRVYYSKSVSNLLSHSFSRGKENIFGIKNFLELPAFISLFFYGCLLNLFAGLLDEVPSLFFCSCLLNLLRVYLLDELASVGIDVFAWTLTALRERVGACECRRVCLDEPSPPISFRL